MTRPEKLPERVFRTVRRIISPRLGQPSVITAEQQKANQAYDYALELELSRHEDEVWTRKPGRHSEASTNLTELGRAEYRFICKEVSKQRRGNGRGNCIEVRWRRTGSIIERGWSCWSRDMIERWRFWCGSRREEGLLLWITFRRKWTWKRHYFVRLC